MKIYISADIEGTVGCTDWRETELGEELYRRQVQEMQREVAAACRGAVAGGAAEIYVKDAHDSAMNLSWEGLPEQAHLIRGWLASPYSMVAGIDESFDGCAFIGYHSPAGYNTNPLAHTSSYSKLFHVSINGETASEFDLYHAACTTFGVPVIFLSGDGGICSLAERHAPGILTVPTKYGVGNATVNEHPDAVCRRIEEAMTRAVAALPGTPSVLPENPVLEITFRKHGGAERAAWYKGAERVDEHTVRYVAEDYRDMLIAYMFMEEG